MFLLMLLDRSDALIYISKSLFFLTKIKLAVSLILFSSFRIPPVQSILEIDVSTLVRCTDKYFINSMEFSFVVDVFLRPDCLIFTPTSRFSSMSSFCFCMSVEHDIKNSRSCGIWFIQSTPASFPSSEFTFVTQFVSNLRRTDTLQPLRAKVFGSSSQKL